MLVFVVCVVLSMLSAGVANADIRSVPARNQQAVDIVIARALSQRGVPFAYGGGTTTGPSLGSGSTAEVTQSAATAPGTIPVAGSPAAIPSIGIPGALPTVVLPPPPPAPKVVGFDASGLMVYAFAGVGLKLPRTTGEQYLAGPKVLPAQALPGDLIFYGPNGSQSVAMFLGGGQMVETSDAGVQVSPVRTNNMAPYLVRYIN
jgi:cell wall-associated NlpC family hydrolase